MEFKKIVFIDLPATNGETVEIVEMSFNAETLTELLIRVLFGFQRLLGLYLEEWMESLVHVINPFKGE